MNDGDLKNEKKNPDTCKTLEFRREEADGRTKTGDGEETETHPQEPGEVT